MMMMMMMMTTVIGNGKGTSHLGFSNSHKICRIANVKSKELKAPPYYVVGPSTIACGGASRISTYRFEEIPTCYENTHPHSDLTAIFPSRLPTQFSFSIYSCTAHPFGTGLNFPRHP